MSVPSDFEAVLVTICDITRCVDDVPKLLESKVMEFLQKLAEGEQFADEFNDVDLSTCGVHIRDSLEGEEPRETDEDQNWRVLKKAVRIKDLLVPSVIKLDGPNDNRLFVKVTRIQAVLVKVGNRSQYLAASKVPTVLQLEHMDFLRKLAEHVNFADVLENVILPECAVYILKSVEGEEPTQAEEDVNDTNQVRKLHGNYMIKGLLEASKIKLVGPDENQLYIRVTLPTAESPGMFHLFIHSIHSTLLRSLNTCCWISFRFVKRFRR